MKQPRALFFALALLTASALPAAAFYEYDGGENNFGARGLIRLYGGISQNPDIPALYPARNDGVLAAEGRLIAAGRLGPHLGLDFNGHLFGSYAGSELQKTAEVERSGALEWALRDGKRDAARFAIDQLFLTFSAGRIDLRAGRQPIGLATCFYFTPNDFFAPFAAQNFYRVYKPGVDGARLDFRVGPLSQISLIHALGYAADPAGANGYASSVDGGGAATIARAAVTFARFEWALLGGKIKDDTVMGGSLQGELFSWLGLRAEGHRRQNSANAWLEIAAGAEHRFSNSLTIRYEHFHNGVGASSPAAYRFGATPYPGREYGALGFSYEFTPLFTGQMLALVNWGDNSRALAFYGLFSLSDESELAFGFNIPRGEPGSAQGINSEYGSYPLSAHADFRVYF
ncbi:MAG: hypothetical protein HZA03_03955 [Nitrospinae bacterium]|nr:hypothetical protein [Nitrospinota bacterium]